MRHKKDPKKEGKNSDAGNRTPGRSVRATNVNHYTTSDDVSCG